MRHSPWTSKQFCRTNVLRILRVVSVDLAGFVERSADDDATGDCVCNLPRCWRDSDYVVPTMTTDSVVL